jgi:hypothetical protein
MINQSPKVEPFARLIQGSGCNTLSDSAELLDIFAAAFSHEKMPR